MTRPPLSVFSVETQGDLVLVVDLDGGLSVTNDAENVVAFLVASGIDFTGKRLAYRDTLGTWDELLVRDGRFAGFRHLNAITATRAEQIIRARRGPDPVGLEPLPPMEPEGG